MDRLRDLRFEIADDSAYDDWVQRFDVWSAEDDVLIAAEVERLGVRPRFAIVPLFPAGGGQGALEELFADLKSQIYNAWCLCVPGHTTFDGSDPRFFRLPTTSTRPAELLAAAASASEADFVFPLPVDARLPRQMLCEFVFAIAEQADVELLYGDEDILEGAKRVSPRFKTDYDRYLLLGRDLLGSPACYRRETLQRARPGTLSATTVDNLLHELALRVGARIAADQIVHIPAILCHRTTRGDWRPEIGRTIVADHLSLCGSSELMKVVPAPLAPQWNRVIWKMPEPAPLVSIIVATRDKPDLIRVCADGILNRTDYPSIEMLIVDNGTQDPEALAILEGLAQDCRVRVIRDDGPFNYSALNNRAAEQARGDVFLLLNNDTDVLHADWLHELVALAIRPDVGIVGAKLLYGDGRVQHAGVTFGPDQIIMHQMRLADRFHPGPADELALCRTVSAVTGACLAIRRSVFEEVGGLDAIHLKVAYNDIDLCRRVARLGYTILWTPHAELLHLEYASRGLPDAPEKVARERRELLAFWKLHPEFYEHPDPFHNPNIVFGGDSTHFACPPRRPRPWLRRARRLPPFFY